MKKLFIMQRSTWAHLRSETEKAIDMGMVEAFPCFFSVIGVKISFLYMINAVLLVRRVEC